MKQPKKNNDLVVSSNDLVNAKYDLTLWQKRVFIYAISKLNKDDKDFKPIRMEITDIIRFFKSNDGKKAYQAILETPTTLDKRIEIPYTTKEGYKRMAYIRLLQKYTLPISTEPSNQYIDICFNSDLKPHLLDLKEKFLKYDIANIIELQSVYSFRMFEILKSYEFRKSIELDVDVLREMLEVTNKYKKYKDFRINVLEKAKEDLTKFCDITFSYEERKGVKGKKIESLLFHIRKNTPTHREQETAKEFSNKYSNVELAEVVSEVKTKKTPIVPAVSTIFTNETSENSPNDKLVMELSPIVVSQFGVSLKVFMGLAEVHTEGAIRQAIQVTQKTVQVGKVANIAGFFVEAVRGKYIDPKENKKQVEVEQKAKLVELNKVVEATEKKVINQKKAVFEHEMSIFTQLIEEDESLIQILIDKIHLGMSGNYYKKDKSFEENLAHPLVKVALLDALKKAKPQSFGSERPLP